MKVAIENFAKMNADNKILLLGGMAELGESSLQEHEDLLQLISKYEWKDVILVGGRFFKNHNRFKKFANSVEARTMAKGTAIYQDSYLLVKGSRSMQMEKVIE